MALILNGKTRKCGVPVIDWGSHNHDFNDAPGTKERTKPPELVMLHWTGGENGVNGLCNTLRARGLGVSFFIDSEGYVFQLLDPILKDPKDVGGYHGRRTISIEIANYGFVLRGRPPKKGRWRRVDSERIHGMHLRVARFDAPQVNSVLHLCEALGDYLNIPPAFPREENGEIAFRKLSDRELREYCGVCGHLHKTEKKVDPGFLLFYLLDKIWFDNPIPEKYRPLGKLGRLISA